MGLALVVFGTTLLVVVEDEDAVFLGMGLPQHSQDALLGLCRKEQLGHPTSAAVALSDFLKGLPQTSQVVLAAL